MQITCTNPSHQRPVTWDISLPKREGASPLLLFLHGFNGFKDWGHWHLLAKACAEKGYVFVKMNFSHNGTSPDSPCDFVDLEAFGQNNFSKELSDVQLVLDKLQADESLPIDWADVTIMGHSRGGGIAILQGEKDPRIHKIITLASVPELDYAWANNPQFVEEWRQKGVFYRLNGRTQQQMPLYYQLYEDFRANAAAFSLASALQRLKKPLVVVHGDKDAAVPLSAADYLVQHCSGAKKIVIEGADHVFGGSHPYKSEELPAHTALIIRLLDY